MERLNLDKNNLRKFGITMATAFLVITAFILFRHKRIVLSTASISVIFFVLAFILPSLLKPIYIFWMRLAFVLSWINTRLILCVMFYLIFAPVGLVMRLFGVDLLDRKIEKNKESYWKDKEGKEFNPLDYERQF
ncbi:MAG: SxtJ family membrane protein [Candidatus Omnitrophica bacterium]|nr:SxtJ family membrane protein [Candidatus Omnitrophota bacterium]